MRTSATWNGRRALVALAALSSLLLSGLPAMALPDHPAGNPVLNGGFEVAAGAARDAACLAAGNDTQQQTPAPGHTTVWPCEQSLLKAANWVSGNNTDFGDVAGGGAGGGDGDREATIGTSPFADSQNMIQTWASPSQAWAADFDALSFRLESGAIPAGASIQVGLSLSPTWFVTPFVGWFWDGSLLFTGSDMVADAAGLVTLEPAPDGEILCPSWRPCWDFRDAFAKASPGDRVRFLAQARIISLSLWGFHTGAAAVVVDDVAISGAKLFTERMHREGPIPQLAEALPRAADRLVALQRADESWGGPINAPPAGPPGHPHGVAGSALLDAYRLTRDPDHLSAARAAAAKVLAKGFAASPAEDIIFILEMASITGEEDYRIHGINAANWWRIYRNPANPSQVGAPAVAELVGKGYAAGAGGKVLWTLALFVEAAKLGGYEAFARDLGREIFFDITAKQFDVENPAANPHAEVGLAGAIYGLALAEYRAYRPTLDGYADRLVARQEATTGAFPSTSANVKSIRDTQATALSAMALSAIGRAAPAQAAARWLVGDQASEGGWLPCYRPTDAACAIEHTRVDAEALTALADAGFPVPSGPLNEAHGALNSANEAQGGHFVPDPFPLAP